MRFQNKVGLMVGGQFRIARIRQGSIQGLYQIQTVISHRSVFDLVRELSSEVAQYGESRLLSRYLKPELFIIDDMGLEILPPKSGEILVRRTKTVPR